MVSEETLDIQVLVRALYDYESEDATNLSFKKDDVIQVLAQLESGWWAGHCDGRQGWFPSNYVQVIGEDDIDSQDEDADVEGEDIDVGPYHHPHTCTLILPHSHAHAPHHLRTLAQPLVPLPSLPLARSCFVAICYLFDW